MIRILLAFGVVLGLTFAGSASAASACKGIKKNACGTSDSCGWVEGYKTKTGTSVKGHCRAKPGKGAAKKSSAAADKVKKSTSKTTDKASKAKETTKGKAKKAKAAAKDEAKKTKDKAKKAKSSTKDKAKKAKVKAKKKVKDKAKKSTK